MSLCLSRLRRLKWALALCPKGSQLSPRSHEKKQKTEEGIGRERNKHNQERNEYNQNPRCKKKEKKLTMMCGKKRMHSKAETLALNYPKDPIQSIQSVQILLKLVSGSRNVKNPKEMEENNGENEARESL